MVEVIQKVHLIYEEMVLIRRNLITFMLYTNRTIITSHSVILVCIPKLIKLLKEVLLRYLLREANFLGLVVYYHLLIRIIPDCTNFRWSSISMIELKLFGPVVPGIKSKVLNTSIFVFDFYHSFTPLYIFYRCLILINKSWNEFEVLWPIL